MLSAQRSDASSYARPPGNSAQCSPTVARLLNPSRLIIGGEVADAGEHPLAGIRENVYRRSTPLATRARDRSQQRRGHRRHRALCIFHECREVAIVMRLSQAA